jgi:hypothetical protein
MVPTILVVPVSVSGLSGGPNDVYPISSFTAYARGVDSSGTPGESPYACYTDSAGPCLQTLNGGGSQALNGGGSTPLPSGKYWRVCLRIVTGNGIVQSNLLNAGVVMAITRCMPAEEPNIPSVSGSDFTVFVDG